MNLGISFGANEQLKGIEYFWYPAQRKWVDVMLNYSDNTITALYEDKAGNLWIAGRGVSKYNYTSDSFQTYDFKANYSFFNIRR